MRYLWVEDFNDGSETELELKQRFKDFFDLQNDKLLIKKDLSSTIEFLEDSNNMHKIDAILIDIRFPQGSTEDIYDKYFNGIVTREFYNKNIEDASGIMLYLLLIFRYHISQRKMAFISANIGNNNMKLKTLQDMIEIIIKSNYKNLSLEDKKSYRTLERAMGIGILDLKSSDEKTWDTFISKEDNIENINKDKLLEQLRALPQLYKEKFNKESNINRDENDSSAKEKYNYVKVQFEKIGFVMPAAFEKPKLGEKVEKRYVFLEWKNELYKVLYNAVRSNILEMCILLRTFLQRISKNQNDIYCDFLRLLNCNEEEKKNYDNLYFEKYINDLEDLFVFCGSENISDNCSLVLKEISGLWEASMLPSYNNCVSGEKRGGKIEYDENRRVKVFLHSDSCFYACHATMKIVRNWVGHQGINGVNMLDVGFVFVVNMRGIFNIEMLPSDLKKEYIKYEDKLMDIFKNDKNVREDITESLEYFRKLNDATKKGKNNSNEIYDRISGLGHAKSAIRRDVSMDEIYMLFYNTISKKEDYGTYHNIVSKIKTRTWENWKDRYNSRFEKYVKA